MIKKSDLNAYSDDDFISEKQICQGTNKTVFSVESVYVVKGIDKHIKKRIEEGKIYLSKISTDQNAEIEEAFLRSLNNTTNLGKNANYEFKEFIKENEKKKTEFEKNSQLDKRKKENEDCYEKDEKYYNDDESNTTMSRVATKEGKDLMKKEKCEENEEGSNKYTTDEYNDEENEHNLIHSSSSCDIYNKYNIQELNTILKKETDNYIKEKEKKLRMKRLDANLEALRLQYIPINTDKFTGLPKDVKENILALFSCIIVKHIDSFDDDEIQNHLDELSKKFLRQLADLLSIDSLAYQSIIKPFEQRKRIREMTGDKTFYELYEKPFIDNLLFRINELQPDIDSKFKKMVEELNNELDFWQSDEHVHADEEDIGKIYVNDILEKDEKEINERITLDALNETEEKKLKVKSVFCNNTKNNKEKLLSNKMLFLEQNKSVDKIELNVETINDYFSIQKEAADTTCNLNDKSQEEYLSNERENCNLTGDIKTLTDLNGRQSVNEYKNSFNDSNNLENCKKENKFLDTINGNNSTVINFENDNIFAQKELHAEKKSDGSSLDICSESEIEKHLNHGVPTKSPEVKSVLLRDLITTYIMTGNNNARIQLYFQKFAQCLKINELLILRIEENLAADLINALQASINETSKKKKMRRIKIAFAALGGGALIAFTAGLAAPGIIAGLTALGAGGSSLTAFLASASGIVFIVSLFGAGGAGLTGYKYSRRIANIKTFEFIMLNGSISKSLSVCVCISGEIKTDDDITRPWLEAFPNCYCDLYCLKWENHLLQTLGSLIETMLSQEFAVTASKIWLQHTIASALSASLTWPLALIKYASNLDNAYLLIRERAQQAGRILADALSDKNTVGQRPVILIGYSMGARVIFYCLKYLYSKKQYNIVSNAIFIGLPATTSTKVWEKIRVVVTNRIVNVYSKNDWLLGFLYRYMEWKINVAGLMPIKTPYVENFDASGIISSHLDYKLKLKDIFNLINFDM